MAALPSRAGYPTAVEWVAAGLPLTHGLEAIRQLLAGASATSVSIGVLKEALVGAIWLAAALATFNRLASHGRRDGSIEFAS